jgi:type II protein arginine methyltransferase
MYRLTDDRKVWYEWMVEVFKLERNSISASTGYSTPVMSDARTTSPDAENGHGRAKQSQRKMFGRSGIRRVRVGISEVHSTIKDGCLM